MMISHERRGPKQLIARPEKLTCIIVPVRSNNKELLPPLLNIKC